MTNEKTLDPYRWDALYRCLRTDAAAFAAFVEALLEAKCGQDLPVIAGAVAAEREACAKIAENGTDYMVVPMNQVAGAPSFCVHQVSLTEPGECGQCIAAAIRARGSK